MGLQLPLSPQNLPSMLPFELHSTMSSLIGYSHKTIWKVLAKLLSFRTTSFIMALAVKFLILPLHCLSEFSFAMIHHIFILSLPGNVCFVQQNINFNEGLYHTQECLASPCAIERLPNLKSEFFTCVIPF